jgi:hypothetical protein
MTENRAVARLVPEVAFPPYSYVPRQGLPHPTADPSGHSAHARHDPPPALEPDRWTENRPYLYGIDLFNAGFYWEAHEVWESLWHAAGRRGPVADFLKGLIKLAAAGVKHREGVPNGVRTHARRAADVWRGVGHEAERFLGFRTTDLIGLAYRIAREGWPSGPVVLDPVRNL